MPFAKHILVPTDFSEASRLAVARAGALANELGARVTLVHVHDSNAVRPSVFLERVRGGAEGSPRAQAMKGLELLRDELLDGVSDVSFELLTDDSPAMAVTRCAEEREADLIVIATHGRTGLKHLLIGSVAERVVRHSSVPVLTLRSDSPD